MADEQKRVLIDVEIKNTDAVKRLADLKKEIAANTAEIKKLDLTKEEDLQASVKLEAANKAYKDEVSRLNKEIQNSIKAQNSQVGSNQRLKAELSNLTAEYNRLSEQERENTSDGKALQAQIKAISDTLKANESAVGNNNRNVGNYAQGWEEAVKSLNIASKAIEQNNSEIQNQIGFLRTKYSDNDPKAIAQIAQLTSKYEQNTQIIEQNRQQIGFLKEKEQEAANSTVKYGEAVTDVSKAGDNAAKTTGVLNQTVGLLSIAFKNNEQAGAAVNKVIQGVAVVTTVANIAKEKDAILSTLQTVKVGVLTAAQTLYSIAVGKSTGAMKLFRLAVAATGVGALVILLGELIFNFDGVQKQVRILISRFEKMRDEVTKGNKVLNALVSIFIALFAPVYLIIGLIFDFTGTVRKMGDVVNSAIGVLDGLAERLGLNVGWFDSLRQSVDGAVRKIIDLSGANKKLKTDIEALNKVLEYQDKQFKLQTENLRANIELAKARGDNERNVAIMERQLLQQTSDLRRRQYEQAIELQKRILQANGTLTEEQQKLLDKVTDEFKKSSLDLAVFDTQQEANRRERQKEAYESRKAELEKLLDLESQLYKDIEAGKIDAQQDGLAKQIDLIELERRNQLEALDRQLADIKVDGDERIRVQELINQRKAQINDDSNKKILEAERTFRNKRAQADLEGYQNSFLFQQKELKKQLDNEIQYLDASVISEKEKAKQKIEANLAYMQSVLELRKKFALEDEILSEQEVAQIQHLQNEIQKIQDTIAGMDTLAGAIGITPDQLQQAQDAFSQIQSGFQALSDIINGAYQIRLNNIQSEYQAQIEAIEGSTLSEEKKKEKIEKLNQEQALAEWKIQKEQFEVNQATSIVNAVIAGALSIMQAFAQLGPIGGAISAAAIAVLTGVQVGVIASQTPPKKPSFFDGGFTEMSGNPYLKSRTSNDLRDTHHNEYITPWKVLRQPKAWPYIAALEGMRKSTPGSLRVPGFADGGFTARALSEEANQGVMIKSVVSEILANYKPVVKVTDINRVNSQMGQVSVSSEI